jgi:hypothetical protein
MPAAQAHHRYTAHAAHEDRHHGHTVEAASFEEAAVAFVEAWHPAVDADGDVSVIVVEADSGHQQCFRVDLDGGDARPCD